MSETMSYLGIALFHRAGLAEVVANAGSLLALLRSQANQGGELRLLIGGEDAGPASELLPRLSLAMLAGKRDAELSIVDDLENPSVWARLGSMQSNSRAVAPQQLGIILAGQSYDATALEQLILGLDVRYGFVEPCNDADAAHDEVFWPQTALLRAEPERRRHSNAWIQIMRAFGRQNLGLGVPDVYWGNILGSGVINELRRCGCWDELEQQIPMRYLSSGAVFISLDNELCSPEHPRCAARRQQLGDFLSTVGLMQRALQQARQGDQLLLNALVATRDLRLLPGLAYPDGLEAFRQVAGSEAGEIKTVADAQSYLAASAAQRPLGYGETRPASIAIDDDNVVASSSSTVELPRVESGATTAAAETPASAAPVRTGGWAWTIRSIARGSLRLELATVQWSAESKPDSQRLELGLLNTTARPMRVVQVRAVRLLDGQPTGIFDAGLRDLELPAAGGRISCALDVAHPSGQDALILVAGLSYRLHETTADVIVEASGPRLLSAVRSSGASWPADTHASVHGHRLLVKITNTTQEPWARWRISLGSASESSPFGEIDAALGAGVLAPGATGYVELDTRKATQRQPLQILLDAEAAVEEVLAVFEPNAQNLD
ncbi:MAG: hypothetical protein RBU37_18860 [Myxococcota bacterium]|jgi:hypothetical protein|nr:hypothetical protein [Myxococcota bacterium]